MILGEKTDMHQQTRIFLGIDVGTSGVRALAVTEAGQVIGQEAVPLAHEITRPREGVHEQPPEAWWEAVCRVTSQLIAGLRTAGYSTSQLEAVAVDGTSGTLVVLDAGEMPLRPAMMYNDARGEAEAESLSEAAGDFCRKHGYRFNSSFALVKIAWLRQHEAATFNEAAYFVHQTDYVTGRLTGRLGVTDHSNALKTGYDLTEDRWPPWIEDLLGIGRRLPAVVAPGTRIGTVTPQAASATGLPEGLTVVAGLTDGTAAFLASGTRRLGDYNTTLGTTLVFKGISRQICRHAQGLIYCHKLPGGLWLPGAASNTGGEWIDTWFPEADLPAMDAAAAKRMPGQCLAYPLVRTGERFPFLASAARGFFVPEPADDVERYTACLEGVALVERLAYEVLDQATGTSGGEVYSTGGGSHSDVWMQCRADVTGRVLHRPAVPESAFGAAVLAAASGNGDWAAAVARMVHVERTFTPNPARAKRYRASYEQFCEQLEERGYVEHLQTV
jgi:xylulokinase